MKGTARSLLLGSILISAIGFSACSDEEDENPAVGGADTTVGGKTNVGGKTSAGGKANTGGTTPGVGGKAGVGGVGVGGVGVGGVTGVGGKAVGGAGVGGAGVGGAGVGGSTAGATGVGGATAGATGVGGATAGATGVGGATAGATGVGGATAGATGVAGSTTGVGGATAGTTGVAGSTTGVAGSTTGVAGSTTGVAGSDSGVAGSGTAGAAGAAGAASTGIAFNFDTMEGWDFNAGWTGAIGTAEGATVTAASGVATLSVPYGTASNTASKVSVIVKYGTWDLSGKTITLKIRWVSGGIGPATGATGGFNIYLNVTDTTGYTGSPGPNAGEFTAWGGEMGSATFKTITYAVPAATADFDPTSIGALVIRVDSKYWGGTPQPVFDYTPAVFEIDSYTIN